MSISNFTLNSWQRKSIFLVIPKSHFRGYSNKIWTQQIKVQHHHTLPNHFLNFPHRKKKTTSPPKIKNSPSSSLLKPRAFKKKKKGKKKAATPRWNEKKRAPREPTKWGGGGRKRNRSDRFPRLFIYPNSSSSSIQPASASARALCISGGEKLDRENKEARAAHSGR